MKRGEAQYDFVEVMACPGGCVGGGGQPIHDGQEFAENARPCLRHRQKKPIRFQSRNRRLTGSMKPIWKSRVPPNPSFAACGA
ncbi:MAG: [Fe-Fe] hydrogenase large subunit C-terminal domain-containing protein [Christensenellales bacterium]